MDVFGIGGLLQRYRVRGVLFVVRHRIWRFSRSQFMVAWIELAALLVNGSVSEAIRSPLSVTPLAKMAVAHG